MKRLILLFVIFTLKAAAQDMAAARNTIDTLTSSAYWGRGYTKNGMGKAAAYISHAFKSAGLKPIGNGFMQPFSYAVNTFPGKMEFSINGKQLVPGKEFIVYPSSSAKKGTIILQEKDSATFIAPAERLVVRLEDKLTWSVAQLAEDYTGIQVDKKAFTGKPVTVSINIENVLIPAFQASNIFGIVPGTKNPDSILVFTAHYDHLGGMGEHTFFPGANDNSSGVALLLSLAQYYGTHPQPYSIAFICFAGEEAGILGSKYFTEHPMINLSKIRFLINVDMVGTGEKGITVVNATLHPAEFAMLNRINDQKKYLPKINSRGKAANSDHYYFTEKDVPAFFIYTQGGIEAYHDVNDLAKTLPLTEFKDLYNLILDFNKALMNNP